MSVDQSKVSISAGVFVEYKVEPGTITIEAKTAGGDLGVLDLTTGQARQLQLALLEVLGEPLGNRPVTAGAAARQGEYDGPGGLEMLAALDDQPAFSVLPASVRSLIRNAVTLQGAWVGNDIPVLQRLSDDLLDAVHEVWQDDESECWLLSSAWLKARGEVG